MASDERLGHIVVLNGAPRSGKSSIAAAIQESFDGLWMNLGVDRFMAMTPSRYFPGIGLRPGGERPDLEPMVARLYGALYDSIAAHSHWGVNVVVDVGHHDAYSKPLGILPDCARRLQGLPTLFVGVRCPVAILMERRRAAGWDGDSSSESDVKRRVELWDREVHKPGDYDMEVDTSLMTPEACAEAILSRLDEGPVPSAFQQLSVIGSFLAK